MELRPAGTSILTRTTDNGAAVPEKREFRGRGVFGQILDHAGNAPGDGSGGAERYQITPEIGSSARAFAEMPIMAPARVDLDRSPITDEALVSPPDADKQNSDSATLYAKTDDLSETRRLIERQAFPLPLCSQSACLSTRPYGDKPGRVGDGAMQSVANAPRHASAATKFEVQTPDADIRVFTRPRAGAGFLSNITVRILRSEAGTQIMVRLSRLSDNEASEMKSRIYDLARHYGFNIDDVRVGRIGKG